MYFLPFLIILDTKKPLQTQTMAACGSLEHIFEKPLPENPTLLESLSPWKHMKAMKPVDDSSFTEIFGELHFKENNLLSSPKPSSSSSLHSGESPVAESITSLRSDSSSFCPDEEKNKNPTSSYCPTSPKRQYKPSSDSFSSMNSESLLLCTEGLGFESFDDVEDLVKFDVCCNNEWQQQEERKSSTRNIQTENHLIESKKSGNRGEFPPPISCIGKSGKPWVCFKSYRENGRFILKEIRIPTQEFLHACRENGRLKLQFIQSDDEILEEDEEEEDEDEDEDEDDIQEQFEDSINNEDDKQEWRP
ncbi:hypothetical protein CDL12_06586 [Handroanthus impetiginosus]|uniref:FAF domain-containing protein n=1 Tax=Handroanthus impetiginosus TaxID=429701 RepID=A0A2G9HT91_9LAMI|nr:hypothetical protein CDL12_06586 [Handroanthus impetiginosus]